MNTYFITYRLCNHGHLYYDNDCYTLQTATFAFHKVVLQHYSGEVGEFLIFWCGISLGYCTPKIIEIDSVFTIIRKWKAEGRFWDTLYIGVLEAHYI